jgi:hypothetical protein
LSLRLGLCLPQQLMLRGWLATTVMLVTNGRSRTSSLDGIVLRATFLNLSYTKICVLNSAHGLFRAKTNGNIWKRMLAFAVVRSLIGACIVTLHTYCANKLNGRWIEFQGSYCWEPANTSFDCSRSFSYHNIAKIGTMFFCPANRETNGLGSTHKLQRVSTMRK